MYFYTNKQLNIIFYKCKHIACIYKLCAFKEEFEHPIF